MLGERVAMPILVAPTAFHGLAHPDGELATVRAAGDAGTIFVLSTLSNTAVEDVVAAATGPVWFQLYVYKDRGATEALVDASRRPAAARSCSPSTRRCSAGASATSRIGFALPAGLAIENMFAAGYGELSPRRAPSRGSRRTSRRCSIRR